MTPETEEGLVTLKTYACESGSSDFPECRRATEKAWKEMKKTMAKDIPEETTDDTDDEAPRRRTTEEVKRLIRATLASEPKQLIDIVEESGLHRSIVNRRIAEMVDRGEATRHPGGAYSLPGGEAEAPAPAPARKPRAKKPAPVEAPEPVEEEAPADDTFSAD